MRLVEQAGGTAQASSVVVEGTASYMAPEQASGQIKAVGPWTDVYGMGAILYEILTSRPPFRSDSFMKTLARVLEDEPELPRRLRQEVPVELEAICLKCLARTLPIATTRPRSWPMSSTVSATAFPWS